MIFVSFLLFLLGVGAIGAYFFFKENYKDRGYDSARDKEYKTTMRPKVNQLWKVGLGLIALSWIFTSIVTISAGEVGIVTRLGAVTGRELGPGVSFKMPFPAESVIVFDTRVQKQESDASAASNDLQDVQAKLSVNYHLNRGDVSSLYQRVGVDFEDKLLSPAIQEVFKATSSKFTAQDLIRQRTEVKAEATKALAERMKEYGIAIDSVNLVNFTFSDEFTKAIEQSQVAQQQVVKATNDLERIKKEAEQKIESARGEAEAQRQQAQSITPEYLQLQTIQKWNGVYPSTVVGGGTVPLVNLPNK